MRARSAKMEQKYVERRKLVERLLLERPLCEACQLHAIATKKHHYRTNPSTDIHELVSRGRGGSILDESNLLAICRFPCHRWITDKDRDAEWYGLSLPSWSNDEMLAEAAERRALARFQGFLDEPPSWRQ